jgi:hypothetical protein
MKIILAFLVTGLISAYVFAQPISLHPDNNRYFIYQGKPLVLVTSAEHYGAVINLDFDYETYLHTLQKDGMNYTRIFSGAYIEIPGSFNIGNNTLAPLVGRYIAPWKRTSEPGVYEGEKQFDLSSWNDEYFVRLKRFVALAKELDIIVEFTFFSSTYQDAYWQRNPFNPGNNSNEIPINLERKSSNTTKNGVLMGYQVELVKKVVAELNPYDNLFYEIQNEPWSDNPLKVMRILKTLNPKPGEGDWFKWAEMASDISLDWQKILAQTIVSTEKNLPNKHLIAQNYTNFKYAIDEVDSNISILNFHYAWPEAVWLNYGWNRPIGFDESGFDGMETDTYLRQAWQFILSGGAIFNNLDYSFFVGSEDGTGANNAPGAGSTEFRGQLKFLREFVESMDFVNMQPAQNVVFHSPGTEVHCLAESGEQYAMVLSGEKGKWLKMNIEKGKYNYEFICPYRGEVLKKRTVKHKAKAPLLLNLPEYNRMLVLKIIKH